jgi:CRP-like cAMP-binding protein
MADGFLRKARFAAGTVIFSQDDSADTAYLIQEGQVELVRRGTDGMYDTLGVIGPGQVFGEDALLSDGPRRCTARADEDSALVAISRTGVQGALDAADPFVRGLYEVLSQNLRSVLDRKAAGGPPS